MFMKVCLANCPTEFVNHSTPTKDGQPYLDTGINEIYKEINQIEEISFFIKSLRVIKKDHKFLERVEDLLQSEKPIESLEKMDNDADIYPLLYNLDDIKNTQLRSAVLRAEEYFVSAWTVIANRLLQIYHTEDSADKKHRIDACLERFFRYTNWRRVVNVNTY